MTAPLDSTRIPCQLHGQPIQCSASLSAVSEVFSKRERVSIIGGNSARTDADRFSYWAAEPKETFEFKAGQSNPFGRLARLLSKYKLEKRDGMPPAPFLGGWIGYFAYELGRYIEKLPETTVDNVEMPLIRLSFYDRWLAFDHRDQTLWAMALAMPNDVESPSEKLSTLASLIDKAQDLYPIQPTIVDVENVDFSSIVSNFEKEDYLLAIEKTKRYIVDGEIYQVNLSQCFQQSFQGRPIDLFHWQNCHNPSPYSAYIDTGRTQIVSASPEMFITVKDGWIQTQPIKGTRPRLAVADPSSNRINDQKRAELLNCEKERAELNMIVDLERNDLARICIPGTRTVIQPRTIEAYPTVFHAVATVGGQLRPDIGFCDILKAVFPGGSITGAPKVRAMEIIDELEPTTRGVYTGSVGFIGLDGTVCLNIAIRTVIIAARQAFVQSGGGIVADSVPSAEWDETITKARALLAGIAATNRP